MAFNAVFVVAVVVIGLVSLMIVGTSGVMFFKFFRNFNRVISKVETEASRGGPERTEGGRRAREMLSQQAPGAPACKCRGCGAIVDSTAELSADGKIRCNYCNQWSSIYQ